MIHPGLATHRGVDLGEQGGRHLDEIDAALVAGGSEPGDVADHTATEGDHRGATIAGHSEHRVPDALHRGQRLVRLSVR